MNIFKLLGYVVFSLIYHLILNYIFVFFIIGNDVNNIDFILYEPIFYFSGYLLLFTLPIFFLESRTVIFLTAFVALAFLTNNFILIKPSKYDFSSLGAIFSPVISYVVLVSYLIFKNKKLAVLILLVAFALLMFANFYSDKKSTLSRLICLYQEPEVEILKAFSKNNGMTYTITSDGNCFQYSDIDRYSSRKIDKIHEYIADLKPLLGRIDSWGISNQNKLELLKKHGIDARIISFGGADFVTWHIDDVADAERILEYPEWKKQKYKRLRKYKGNVIESDKISPSSYQSWSARTDSVSSKAVYDATEKLSYLRYYQSITSDKQVTLIRAWQLKQVEEDDWTDEVLNSDLFRIILAEVLYKHDPSNQHEYYNYIISMLKNNREVERSYAALSLGYIGMDRDIDTLADILLNDHEIPAVRAGYGLITMDNPAATRRLEEVLSELSQKSDRASLATYKTVKMSLNNWQNRDRNLQRPTIQRQDSHK